MYSLLVCVLFLFLLRDIGISDARSETPTKVYIGVLLEEPTQREQDIVELAVNQINESNDLLENVVLSYTLKTLPGADPYEGTRKACSMLDKNISALITSTSCESNLAIQSFAEDFNIPHFAVPRDKCPIERNNSFTVSVRPLFEHQNTMLFDIIKKLSWIKIGIFYDSNVAYRNVEDLLKEAASKDYHIEVTLFRLEKNTTTGDLITIQSLHMAKTSKIKKIIAFCKTSNSLKLMQQAANYGMAIGDYKWIVTTQDFALPDDPKSDRPHTLESAGELQFFNTTDTGIITLLRNQIVIKRKPEEFMAAWMSLHPHLNHTVDVNISSITPDPLEDIQTTAAYLFDAIRTAASVINLQISRDWTNPKSTKCFKRKRELWTTGMDMKDVIRTMKPPVEGLMGPVDLFKSDVNNHVSMEVLTIQRTDNISSSTKIGTWNRNGGLNLTAQPFARIYDFPPNTTLRIVTIEEAPFVMKEVSVYGPKYTGFCIDLIERIAKELNFKYTLYEVPDGNYGVANQDGQWNGLIGEVYYNKAEIALAGMVINSDREGVIDFTKPYMNYGVGILMKKPQEQKNVFAFLDPLHCTVWFSILAALFVVGIMVYFLDRLSPYSSYRVSNRNPDVDDFNFRNSMWFAFASCMQQGGDNTPISMSGRILSAAWWMFALIIIATYTANLAAFLTVTRMENPINSLEDLAYQQKIAYGTINDSSLHRFFRKRKQAEGVYQMMWHSMESRTEPSAWVDNDTEGYRRVSEGNYAFFWDAPILDYIKQTECDLMTVGKPFNLKGYGIGTAEGSLYRDKMSMTILKLQERGELEELRKKWFERESICNDDPSNLARNANANEIGLGKIAGAFYILLMGIALSFIVVAIEHLTFNPNKNKKRNYDNKYESDWREVRTSSRNNGILENSPDWREVRTSRNNGILENTPHIVVRNEDSVALSPLRPTTWSTSINSESAC